MSDASVALTFKLKVGNGAEPEVFKEIAEVVDVPQGPATGAENVECTSTKSNGWREYKKGLRAGGTLNFSANAVMNDETHQQLISDAADGTIRNYQLCWGDADETYDVETVQSFAAIVDSCVPTLAIGQIIKLEGVLQITGPVETVARHASAP